MGEWDVVEQKKVGEWDVVKQAPQHPSAGGGYSKGEPLSGNQMIKEWAPIAGDVAATILAPQAKIPLEAGKWGVRGVKLLNAFLRGGGSATGTTGGRSIANQFTGEQTSGKDMAKEAGIAALGEIGVSGLGAGYNVTKKVLKPIFEQIPKLTFGGTAVRSFYNNKFKKEAADRAQDFLVDVAPTSIKKQAVGDNKNLNIMTSAAYSEKGAAYKLYNDALDEAAKKEGGVIPLDDTAQMIGELFQKARENFPEKGFRQLKIEALEPFGYAPKVRNALANLDKTDLLDPELVKELLANVFQNKGWKNVGVAQRRERELLKDSIMADIERVSKDVWGLKRAADDEYKALIKFNFLRRIYDRALYTANEATGKKMLQPAKLHEAINVNKGRILDDPDLAPLWPQLEKEADAALKTAKQMEASEQGGESIFSRTIGPAVGSFVTGSPTGGMAVEGFGTASAWLLLSEPEKSIVRKIFNTGATAGKFTAKQATKAGVHLGGRELFPQDDVTP